MDSDETDERRVRFYGAGDYATHWRVEDAAAILRGFDPNDVPATVANSIELHNVQQFAEQGFLPTQYTDAQRLQARAASCSSH